jgi:hypothetical protein
LGWTEAEIVVAVAWRVPVAIRRAQVDGVVVPAAAAFDAVGAAFDHAPAVMLA